MLDRPRLKLLFLLAACLAAYLVGNSTVPLWDRDEPRFAQTSRQMLESGDWVVPRLYDNVRTAKPPLIYWAQAASMKLIGDQGPAGVFAARLPSSLAMMLTLTIIAVVLWRHAGPDHAIWTVFILSTCALVVLAAKTGLTDSVLLLFVTIAQLCLYAIWRGRGGWGVAIVMAVAIALALLTKGPVAVGIQIMTLIGLGLLRWNLRRAGMIDAPSGVESSSGLLSGASIAKWLVGLLIVLAIGLPWVILVEKRYPGFISTALNHEIKDRAASGLEGHKGPPGYYLVSIWPTFLPWSLVLPLALAAGWKNRRDPRVRFALAAVAGPWLMFEVVQTKLPHYLLPCFPPLAFLAADAIVRSLRRDSPPNDAAGGDFGNAVLSPGPMKDRAFGVAVLAWAAVAVLLGLLPWGAAKWFRPLPWAIMGLVSLYAIAYAAAVAFFFRRHRPAWGLAAMGVGMLGLILILFGLYLPSAPFLQLSNEIGQVLRDNRATGPRQVGMLDYKEPSLAFYQGGTIREETALVANDKVLELSPQWLVMTDDVYRAAATDRSRLEVVARFRGLDLSAGLRNIEVLVTKKRN